MGREGGNKEKEGERETGREREREREDISLVSEGFPMFLLRGPQDNSS